MEAVIGRKGAGLNSVIMASGCPVLRQDGTVAQTNGYDPLTGIFIQLDTVYPTVPESPSRSDAMIALDELKTPLRGFPFATDLDRAVAISAILTSTISFSFRQNRRLE